MMLVAVAWIYVVLMAAVVEATGSQGSVVGALVTFLLYGVLPLGIVMYLMLSPARRRARRAAEAVAAARQAAAERLPTGSGEGIDPDGGDHPAGDTVASIREEP